MNLNDFSIQFNYFFYILQIIHKYAKERRDQFYKQAKLEGYRARSAYKLQAIDNEFHLFDNARNIVDLCCAPGSWSQYISNRVQQNIDNTKQQNQNTEIPIIIGIDLAPIVPIPLVTFIQGDITSQETADKCINLFNKNTNKKDLADVITCDGAPDVTGLNIDEYLQSQLIFSAMKIVHKILKDGGTFVSKIFRGQLTEELLIELSKYFKQVQIVKPFSSRMSSMEAFVVCQGYIINREDNYHGLIIEGVKQLKQLEFDKDSDRTYEN